MALDLDEGRKRKSSLRNANQNQNNKSDKQENDIDDEVEIVHHHNGMDVVDDCDEDKNVEIDGRKMDVMIQKLIKVTKDYNVEQMEEGMYSLLRIICRHSNEWNKNSMPSEMNEHILHFLKAKR